MSTRAPWISLLVVMSGCDARTAPPPTAATTVSSPGATHAAATPTGPASSAPVPASGPCVPAPPEAAQLMTDLGSKPMAFGQRNGYRNDHAQLFRFLPGLHARYTVRSIVQTEGVTANGPIFAVTLLARETPASPMRAHLGFASAACTGGDLALLAKPVPLEADDAIIAWAEPLPAVPPPHDAPLTEVRVVAGKGPRLDTFGGEAGDADTSFLVGAPRGKLTVTGEPAVFGVLGRIDGLRRPVPASPQEPDAREDRPLFGTGWYPVDGGAAFLHVHHAVVPHDTQCAKARGKDAQKLFAPPTLALRARLDAEGLAVDSARVGTAYVVAIPENQPTGAIYGDALHRCRTGPEQHTGGYASAKAQWLYGLFPTRAAATARAIGLGYTTGVVYAAPPRDAPAPGDAPSRIAATPPAGPGPLDCDRF